MKKACIFFFSMFFAIVISVNAAAEQERFAPPESEFVSRTEPVHFSGDRFVYNRKSGVITGTGNIEITQSGNQLQGEKVIIDTLKKVAEISEDVVIIRGGDIVEGESGFYDFGNQEGVFYTSRGHSEPWYFSTDKIERKATEKYVVESPSLTTCNLPNPHYGLRASSATVIPNERLVARDLIFFAGRFPIFYLPYYSHGLGPKRPPLEFSAGIQSDLGGYARAGYNLELSKELSLNPHVWGFTKSGVGVGLDGRLDLFGDGGRGRFNTFYISDLNKDNTDEVGIEKDRGKAEIYYRQELPHDFTALLQAEYISDPEFIKTFDFDDFSERELPETFFNLERTTGHKAISFTVRERLVDYIDEVEKHPELRLELLEQRLGETGFFFGALNDSVYLDIESGGPESMRNFSEARLSYPIRPRNWLALVPFIGGDATYYSRGLSGDDKYRLSWKTGIAAQTRFHKIYGSPFKQYTAFRHLVVPTISYGFRPIPDEEPEELPQFDSIDLIDRENMLHVELRNYLQAKRRDGQREDLLQYNFAGGLEFDDGKDKLATVENEVRIKPTPNWEFSLKSLNDFRDTRRTDTLNTFVKYSLPGSLKASIGVIHEDTVLKPYETQGVYSLSKAFGPLWRAGFEQRYSFDANELTYQEFWVWRDLHCWEILLRLRDRQEATSFMVLVNIKAFPLRSIEKKIAMQ